MTTKKSLNLASALKLGPNASLAKGMKTMGVKACTCQGQYGAGSGGDCSCGGKSGAGK